MAYLELERLPLLPKRRKPARSVDEAEVLALVRVAQRDVHAAEARKLAAAVAWAGLHLVDDPELAARWEQAPITLAGPGAPLIAHSCVAEFGTVIGIGTNGARGYLADAIELAHRLPSIYALTQSGRLPVWRARRIANETTELPMELAADLDARLAPLVTRLTASATQRMVDETIAVFLPGLAQEVADAYSNHKVVVDHRQISFIGTSTIYGALDLADALDLDDALTRDAEALQHGGCTESLDVRRSMALGRLARGEATGRQVTLYVHLPANTTEAALNPTAVLENTGPHLLTQTQVAAWCGNPGVKVTLKPVIDLNVSMSTSAYVVPEQIKEHLQLRDGTCVFAFCTRQARLTEKDHIDPYDPNGPPGQTNTENLACLCAHHHHLKTHTAWTYTMPEPRSLPLEITPRL